MSKLSYFQECFSYDPLTGSIVWKVRPRSHFNTDRGWRCFNNRNAGNEAGVLVYERDGVPKKRTICAGYKKYTAHTVAWVMGGGRELRGEVIDHINGNPFDNRLSNLRPATQRQNSMNCKIGKNNTSGHTGVTWSGAARKWMAQICVNRRPIHLGLHVTKEGAIQARIEGEKKYFGQFRRAA